MEKGGARTYQEALCLLFLFLFSLPIFFSLPFSALSFLYPFFLFETLPDTGVCTFTFLGRPKPSQLNFKFIRES